MEESSPAPVPAAETKEGTPEPQAPAPQVPSEPLPLIPEVEIFLRLITTVALIDAKLNAEVLIRIQLSSRGHLFSKMNSILTTVSHNMSYLGSKLLICFDNAFAVNPQ